MFDITKHEWYDMYIIEADEDEINLSLSLEDYKNSTLTLNKDDAIAIAMHFGLIEKVEFEWCGSMIDSYKIGNIECESRVTAKEAAAHALIHLEAARLNHE